MITDFDWLNNKKFLDKLELIDNNEIINFNIEKESISYFDKEDIFHEFLIPKESKIKYWRKDYIQLNVTTNGVTIYYPIEYKGLTKEY